MINCHQLCHHYDNKPVINHLSLKLDIGKIHVLLGHSGSGKTTLLHILSQLIAADSGSLQIFNQHWQFPLSNKKIITKKQLPQVGLVFQQHSLWPHLTCLQNLTLAPIKVMGTTKLAANQQAQSFLDDFGLSDKADQLPHQLSGGEKQKVAIIRSLMLPYNAIALDEPNASLDPLSTQDLIQTIKKLKSANKTLIISTHDLQFAKAIADNVHFMQQGKMIETGSSACFTHPNTIELKHFLQQQGEKS